MQEVIQFVSTSIASGVLGNGAYNSLKVVLGSSFDKLSSYLSSNEKMKFEVYLEALLDQNEELKQQIIDLQDGKSVTFDNSIKVGGNNSGNIVTGNNNTIQK